MQTQTRNCCACAMLHVMQMGVAFRCTDLHLRSQCLRLMGIRRQATPYKVTTCKASKLMAETNTNASMVHKW